MANNENVQPEEQKGLSRRSVMKGAAWAVPVVALASATPAFATSPKPPVDFTGSGCKDSGGSPGARYFFALTVDPTVGPAEIDFTVSFAASSNFEHVGQQPGAFTQNKITIDTGVTYLLIKFNNPDNANNSPVTISYTYDGEDYVITNDQYSSDCQNRTPPIEPF